jgi:hydrogenase nickel incorporation protein HypA/HybF
MHELSVTSAIVDALLDLVKKHGASQVEEVHLKIGTLRALSVEQVKFCYEILCKGTPLEGSKLIVEEVAGELECSNCNYSGQFNAQDDAYHFGIPPLVCPTCGSSLLVKGGDECVIGRVRMQVPPKAENNVVP